MTLTAPPPIRSALERAARAAATAEARADAQVLEVTTAAECARAAELLCEVWRSSEPKVQSNLIRAIQDSGSYVYGAYSDSGALLAVSIGLLGRELAGEPLLHSHITGVVPAGQRRGLGYALKQHQRRWALERDMTTITWTCDPLMRRNLLFNLHALGAEVHGYLVDHYGRMNDGLNRNDATDRLAFRWDLLGPRTERADRGRLPFLESDFPPAIDPTEGGHPVLLSVAGAERRVALPSDVEALREKDPGAAGSWRTVVRAAVAPALSEGASILGLTRGGELVIAAPDAR
jgi:predicted GNAT superfamily acetyltransferase